MESSPDMRNARGSARNRQRARQMHRFAIAFNGLRRQSGRLHKTRRRCSTCCAVTAPSPPAPHTSARSFRPSRGRLPPQGLGPARAPLPQEASLLAPLDQRFGLELRAQPRARSSHPSFAASLPPSGRGLSATGYDHCTAPPGQRHLSRSGREGGEGNPPAFPRGCRTASLRAVLAPHGPSRSRATTL
jgi:hypothetical protein